MASATTTTTTTTNNIPTPTPAAAMAAAAAAASATSAKKNNETTLTHLTKRFVKLLNSNSERIVNLNEASAKLSVAKRRIYDITNVLEGIGLLQKTSKNVTRWIDCPRDSPYAATVTPTADPELRNLLKTHQSPDEEGNDLEANAIEQLAGADAELLNLRKTYQTLEEGVNDLEANIKQLIGADGAYVTYQNIKSSFNDQIVIAVKAPPDTRLEVNESLQIWMKSYDGPIEVYLCPQNINNTPQQTNPHLRNTGNTVPQPLDAISSDEGRGTSFATDSQYYCTSSDDRYLNEDPTLSSTLATAISEEEDPFRLVPIESSYNFLLEDDYSIASLFATDNLESFVD